LGRTAGIGNPLDAPAMAADVDAAARAAAVVGVEAVVAVGDSLGQEDGALVRDDKR